MELSGLSLEKYPKNCYSINNNGFVKWCYLPQIITKNGFVRLGGGIGLFVSDFERRWYNKISSKERSIDATLPIQIHTGNLIRKINNKIYDYYESNDDIECILNIIKNYLGKFQYSIDFLANSLARNEIMEFPISKMMHIDEFREITDIYLRKSVFFLYWIITIFPDLEYKILSNLSRGQVHLVNEVKKMYDDDLREVTSHEVCNSGDSELR